jgi:hypothetical protein
VNWTYCQDKERDCLPLCFTKSLIIVLLGHLFVFGQMTFNPKMPPHLTRRFGNDQTVEFSYEGECGLKSAVKTLSHISQFFVSLVPCATARVECLAKRRLESLNLVKMHL